jgi:hypothetical protein
MDNIETGWPITARPSGEVFNIFYAARTLSPRRDTDINSELYNNRQEYIGEDLIIFSLIKTMSSVQIINLLKHREMLGISRNMLRSDLMAEFLCAI